jgi:hypothetical protein
MRGGKADKGTSGRKKPAARPTAAQIARTGPKRGQKPREWGAFDTGAGDAPQPAPVKGQKPRKP